MLTTKQRSRLRSMAAVADTIFQIGKGGISEELIRQVSAALEARELIKMTVLETAPLDVNEAAAQLAEATSAEVVATLGRRLILYRESKKKKKIIL